MSINESKLAEWIHRVSPGTAQHEVLMRIGALRLLTGWDEDTLCDRLGCPGVNVSFENEERTTHSLAYLGWVEQLCKQLDQGPAQRPSRRRVVDAAFELCSGAGGQVTERVSRCRAAFEDPGSNELSGMTLLAFGEIEGAFAQAARSLPDGPAKEEQEELDAFAPELKLGHIHPDRLELLISGDEDAMYRLLGPVVARQMREHVDLCPDCRAVRDERERVIEERERGVAAVPAPPLAA